MTRVPDEIGRDVLHVCRRAYERGLVAGTDGNISVRIERDRVVATPTGMCKGFLEPDDLVVCDLDGTQVSGKRRLTTEIKIHLAAYAVRDDVCAVVHAHPPYATAFAVAGMTPSEAAMPEAYIAVGKVALAPYATPSTDALAESLRAPLRDHDSVLLSNHGAMTVGREVIGAYHRMEALEQLCRITCIARDLGGVRPLTREQTEQLEAIRGVYASPGDEIVCCYCGRGGKAGRHSDAGGEQRSSAGAGPSAARPWTPPDVHWPGNPPVWQRPQAEPAGLEARVRDLARRELRATRTPRAD